jgi:hypothetical protein
MSAGDETDSSTHVPIVRYAWVSVTISYRVRHLVSLFLEDPARAALPGTEKPLSTYRVFPVLRSPQVRIKLNHTEDLQWIDRW